MNQNNQKGIKKTTDRRMKEHFDEVFEKFRAEVGDHEFTKFVEATFSTMEMNVAIKQDDSLVNRGEVGKVYYVNFGYNVGSETRGWHYCIVIAKAGAVATVIPLSSKEGNKHSPRISLGILDEINDKESFALLHNTTTVSSARLKDIKVNDKKVVVKLEKEQLNLIISNLTNHFQNSIE